MTIFNVLFVDDEFANDPPVKDYFANQEYTPLGLFQSLADVTYSGCHKLFISRFVTCALTLDLKVHLVFANSGDRAVNAVQENSFHLVFVDYNMNGEKGTKVTERLIEENSELYIVGWTSDDGREEKFKNAGAQDCFEKWARNEKITELLSALKEQVDNSPKCMM